MLILIEIYRPSGNGRSLHCISLSTRPKEAADVLNGVKTVLVLALRIVAHFVNQSDTETQQYDPLDVFSAAETRNSM